MQSDIQNLYFNICQEVSEILIYWDGTVAFWNDNHTLIIKFQLSPTVVDYQLQILCIITDYSRRKLYFMEPYDIWNEIKYSCLHL